MPKLTKSDVRFWTMILRLVFLPVLLLELWAVGRHLPLLELATKPLMVPVLMLIFYFATHEQKNNYNRWIITALIFSLMGDVFLLFSTDFEQAFMTGLASFLLAQISYFIGFLLAARHPKGTFYTLAASLASACTFGLWYTFIMANFSRPRRHACTRNNLCRMLIAYGVGSLTSRTEKKNMGSSYRCFAFPFFRFYSGC